MKPQFLCVHLRQFLSANPCMARRYWERCMQEGQVFMTRSHYRSVLPHFGSGFEIAMILLANDVPTDTGSGRELSPVENA